MRNYGYNECGPSYDFLSDSPLIARLVTPSRLVAVPESNADNGLVLRVYGYDANGRRVYGPDGEDGYPVEANTTNSPTAQGFGRIERVSKPVSKSYVGLYAWNQISNTLSTKLGDYAPNDLEPTFRRIHLSCPAPSIRVAYRKRDRNITSLSDVINLRSKPAIVNAVMALSIRLTDPQKAQELLNQARAWLEQEQAQRDQAMPPKTPEHTGQWDTEQSAWGIY